jgi:DNA repair protein RadC
MIAHDCNALQTLTSHAEITSDIGAIEVTLSQILKSKPTAQRLCQQIFSNAQLHSPHAISRLLRLHLEQPDRLGLTSTQTKALKNAIAFGHQLYAQAQSTLPAFTEPPIAAQFLCNTIGWNNVEQFAILVLDIKNQILGTQVLTKGGLTCAEISPREIFEIVLRLNGYSFIVGHNHPSGAIGPSSEDLELTRNILQGAKVLDLDCLDHFIVSGGAWRSLRESTGLWF